jgi:outer membrane receptor for monomeric catechols
VLRQQVYYSHYFFNLYSNFTFFKNDPLNGDGINQRDTGRSLYGYTGTYDRDDQLGGRSLHTTFGLGTRLDNAGLLLRHVAQRVPLDTINIGRLYEQNGNAYLDETLTLTDRLTLNAALRADLFIFQFRGQRADSAVGFVPLAGCVVRGRVSPKLNLYYQLSPAVQLFARSGLGFHSNDAQGVVQGSGSFQALPCAAGAEVGSTLKPVPSLVVNAALWTLHLQDELVYSGDEGTTESVGPTQRYGVDVSARYQLSSRFFLDGDFNYSHGRLVAAPEGENYIPLAPTFASIEGLTMRTAKGLNVSLRYRHIASRPAQEDNAIRARGYFLLDAVLNYTTARYQVGTQAQNLLNVQWNEA